MDETVWALRAGRPARIGFYHGTGLPAVRRLWNEFPDACLQAHAGMKLELPD
jgi:metal-dependent hydrolase (beta-lactamase superfamily II)